MEHLQIWAQPWWVNLLLLVPVFSYLFWRRSGLLLSWNKLLALAFFAASFGFVEASVVVYLRAALAVPAAVSQAQVRAPSYEQTLSILAQFPPNLRAVEVYREAATMVMLISVAFLAGTKARERWAGFLWAFATWDLTYYVGLWRILGWPTSLKDYDVLFLIPVPWFSQVWYPVLVSGLTLIAVALAAASSNNALSRTD